MPSSEALQGTILVTGGASGLGAAVAQSVADAGGRPVILDRQEPASGFDWVRVDLADARAAERVVDELASERGDLRGVVTAAGTDACGRIDDVDPADWDRVIAVNLVGTAAVVRAAVPHLERTGGRVVTVASTLGLRALSDATAYCASKFGVVGFTRGLALDLAGRVGVTLLVPGGMQTHFFDDRDPTYQPGEDAELNDPGHVAQGVLFALRQPPGCEVRELVITPSTEPSWP